MHTCYYYTNKKPSTVSNFNIKIIDTFETSIFDYINEIFFSLILKKVRNKECFLKY